MTDRSRNNFQTTHWTQVIAARGSSPEARQALRSLCETYYEPIALFIRRSRDRGGHRQSFSGRPSESGTADEFQDLAHDFFARLLEGDQLDLADRTRGRFRSYLLGAVKHFLADQRDTELALKRGGGPATISLSATNPSSDKSEMRSIDVADLKGFPPDAYFDRQWGITVVQQAISSLKIEEESNGTGYRFSVLQRWLVAPASQNSAIESARSLNLSDGAFKVAVHRLRKRFRQIVVERISATVDDPAEINDELNYLIQAVSSAPKNS